MAGFDYSSLGLKCGVEIHQQLEGKKLFCSCPTLIRKDKPDFTVQRRLRASAGEAGMVDVAALHEQKKGKAFLYQGYYDTTCLVELDEEPPGAINQDALRISLQVAALLNCTLIDEIQVMRKTVIDGSNTSGFQRTALVGRNGSLAIHGKTITIPTVCLEEESCQVMERTGSCDVYNLSRLGIPLIEISTGPDMTAPEECKTVALQLGMILRSVPGLKRGIGSIRQDVNISIKGGARTEIKGFQEVHSIPTVIEYEIKRQQGLLQKKKGISEEVRKAEQDGTTSFLRPMPGAARMYPETDVLPITTGVVSVGTVELLDDKAKKLEALGIGKDLASAVAKEGNADFVMECARKYSQLKPAFIAETILSTPITIRRKEGIEVHPAKEEFSLLFHELASGAIAKEAVYDLLVMLGSTGKLDFSKFKLLSSKQIEEEVQDIIAANKGKPQNVLVGIAMGKLRGKADPQQVIMAVKKWCSG
ncbi:Glu-tRNA(Gln) amidotransferase subunit GatE [Candidatus Woesearchaeota archaeon]|nr:Glu-tRNA(Gln) amidotransferase subunit GatE [Candidatus Woesearchaeota archaeon]